VPLFPIQLVESIWVLAVVGRGIGLLLAGAPAGTALAWYLVAYAIGRFGLELGRGDRGRRYLAGFSEAQWLSLLTLAGVALAEWLGWLPPVAWHGPAAAGLGLLMAALALYRRYGRPAAAQGHEWHEIAAALARLDRAASRAGGGRPVPVAGVAGGLRLSAGTVEAEGGRLHLYTFSAAESLDEAAARRLAQLVMRLRHRSGRPELFESSSGVFHLVVRP
jgi:hypothetical protein